LDFHEPDEKIESPPQSSTTWAWPRTGSAGRQEGEPTAQRDGRNRQGDGVEQISRPEHHGCHLDQCPPPRGGPSTSYGEASKAGIIAASTDPVALDSWATREILMPAARALGYKDDDLSSMDPDSSSPGSFGSWLRLSMQQMQKAGYRVTMDEDCIDVKVSEVR